MLSACSTVGPPSVVFPSRGPALPSGPGAVVWADSGGCPGAAGARIATIGAGDVPGPARTPRNRAGRDVAPLGPLQVSPAPLGRILLAGRWPGHPGSTLVDQGRAGQPFRRLPITGCASAAVGVQRAYLGDIALACTPFGGERAGGLLVRVERHRALGFMAPLVADPARHASGPVLALDYRSDVLVAWTHGGWLYARYMPRGSPAGPVQRVARIAAGARTAAIVSDDGRGILAWSELSAGRGVVRCAISGAGVRFGATRTLESFALPADAPPAASVVLTRLSAENVLIAWAGAQQQRWVIRLAPLFLTGAGPVSTIAEPGGDALLDSLAAGPDDDALVLWTAGAAGAAAPSLYASAIGGLGIQAPPAGAPQLIDGGEPISDASAAIDPSSGRALAVWTGAGGEARYSVSAPGG